MRALRPGLRADPLKPRLSPTMENLLIGLLALVTLGYLAAAVLFPEKF